MAETVNYQCPSCGGPLHFDATIGKLKCDYCDSAFTAEEVEAAYAAKQAKEDARAQAQSGEHGTSAAERVGEANAGARAHKHRAVPVDEQGKPVDPIQAYLNSKTTMAQDDPHATCVTCSSCGAELITSDVSAITQCPYCGNNAMVPGKMGNTLKPDYVIPFSTTKEQATEALNKHYGGKICLPKAFKDGNHVEEIQGVYVPFWLFNGMAKGEASYHCENIRMWSDEDYDYEEISSYREYRSGLAHFSRVPVDGSKRMPDDHMDSIEPFDYGAMVPYSAGYLPGFLAERYDDTVEDTAPRATKRMIKGVADELDGTVMGYNRITRESNSEKGDTDFDGVGYALLPVWMLHTRWNDQDFLFAMNGQTGKLIGDLPLDKGKLNLISIVTFVIVFVICFLLGMKIV